jgi:hypothetical protein
MSVSHQIAASTARAGLRYNRFYHLKGIEVDFERSSYNAFFSLSVKMSPLPARQSSNHFANS